MTVFPANSDSEPTKSSKVTNERKPRTSRQASSDVEYRASIYITDTDWDGNR